jgi:hypothetical protein
MPELPARIGPVDPDALARDDAAAKPVGGFVERTGLGLLRRGETVIADPQSVARLAERALDVEPAVTIEIPVTVEVGPSAEQITQAAADLALRRLREAMQARTVG